jgi:hypothetical protein
VSSALVHRCLQKFSLVEENEYLGLGTQLIEKHPGYLFRVPVLPLEINFEIVTRPTFIVTTYVVLTGDADFYKPVCHGIHITLPEFEVKICT